MLNKTPSFMFERQKRKKERKVKETVTLAFYLFIDFD